MSAYTWLEERSGTIESDLIEVCNQNSGSENLAGLLQVADWIEDWMDLRHVTFHRVHLPPRHVVNDQGKEIAIEAPPALRWDFQPDQTRRVLLMIHYDTVFTAEHPFQACELESTDRLRGPGVADAKGGILVIRNAMKAAIEFSLISEIGCTILLNPDEELGSPSSAALIRQTAPEFDFALLFEPTLPTGELVAERKGSGNFDVVVSGKSAHAGRHFEEGRNAITALCQLLTAVDQLNGQRSGLTINVGNIRGGGAVNVVPERAVGRFNVRAEDDASTRWFDRRLKKILEATNSRDGIECRLVSAGWSPPKLLTPELSQLMRAVELSSIAIGGHKLRWRKTGGVCDGNKLAAAGLPNVDTLGPLGDCLHSDAEWVQPSTIVERAKLVVNLLSRFSQGEFGELQRDKSVATSEP